MIVIDTGSDLYARIRTNFWQQDQFDHFHDFDKFVQYYGGVIVKDKVLRMAGHDSCGIMPGYDEIRFSNDEDYTFFVLRWG